MKYQLMPPFLIPQHILSIILEVIISSSKKNPKRTSLTSVEVTKQVFSFSLLIMNGITRQKQSLRRLLTLNNN